MKPIEENGHVLMVILIMVTFNLLFLSANGLFMPIAPRGMVLICSGVTDTGFFNQHFIRDIGLIQLFLGVAFVAGFARPERRIGLWLVATLCSARMPSSTCGKWPWASVLHRSFSAISPPLSSPQSSGRP